MSDDPNRDKGGPKLPPSGMADEILRQLASGELDNQPVAPPREPPPGAAANREVDRIYTFTDSLQLGQEEEEEREVFETWVEFRLASETYALPVSRVREILRVREVTPVPHPPFPVVGVINLRGRVVPLLDLRLRMSLPAPPPDEQARVVLVESQKRRIGLLVDAVERVAKLAKSGMQPPEAETEAAEVGGLYTADDLRIRLLDLKAVLTLRD